jgi:transposase
MKDSNKLEEDIVRLRNDNKVYSEIAKTVGCSKSTVHIYCHRNNIIENKGEKLQVIDENKIELIKSLTKKYTVDEVSKMLNIGRTTIKKYKDTIVPKKVYQYGLNNELIKIWNSTTEITDNTKYNKNTIKNACNGNAGRAKNIAYNYKWVYEKLDENENEKS